MLGKGTHWRVQLCVVVEIRLEFHIPSDYYDLFKEKEDDL